MSENVIESLYLSDHKHRPLPRLPRHHRRHLLRPDRDRPQQRVAPQVLQPGLLQDDEAAEMVGQGGPPLVHREAAGQGLCHVPLGQVGVHAK